jgi:hypothetical protein
MGKPSKVKKRQIKGRMGIGKEREGLGPLGSK